MNPIEELLGAVFGGLEDLIESLFGGTPRPPAGKDDDDADWGLVEVDAFGDERDERDERPSISGSAITPRPSAIAAGQVGRLRVKFDEPRYIILYADSWNGVSQQQTLPGLFENREVLSTSDGQRFIAGFGTKVKKSPSTGAQQFVGIKDAYAVMRRPWTVMERSTGIADPISDRGLLNPSSAMAIRTLAKTFGDWLDDTHELLEPGTRTMVPGTYHVAPWPHPPQAAKWEFLTGYWRWSRRGPRKFNASDISRRLLNGNCTERVTRVWAHLIDIPLPGKEVTIEPGKRATVRFQPVRLIYIPEHSKFQNSDSKAIGKTCKVIKRTGAAKVAQPLLTKLVEMIDAIAPN